jgi:methylmalonyl-CoA/ethylmalonyl-CoA epimerase
MIVGVEHIGIAVEDPQKARDVFSKIIGFFPHKEEMVESEKVKTHFYSFPGCQVELLESLDSEGVISKYIQKKGKGMHHLALKTDDIEAEISRLLALGFEFISPIPKQGADGKKIVFLHPKFTEGVLIELCQDLDAIN